MDHFTRSKAENVSHRWPPPCVPAQMRKSSMHEGELSLVPRFLKWRQAAWLGLLITFVVIPVSAQEQGQFWPEIDTYFKVNSKVRLSFFAQQTRENDKGEDAEIGPSLDVYVKPLIKAKRFVFFQLDESKSRLLMLRNGYRYMPSTSSATEQRIFSEATARFPLTWGVLVSDRNRVDLRWINDEFSWRYRNRLTAERDVKIRSYHFAPYVRAEAFFDSRYGKFSRTTEDAGATFPIHKSIEIEPYYEHQNDSSKSPNRQVNAFGFVLSLYFLSR